MELTKQQAIKEHRKMWNWIADQLENHGELYLTTVGELKEEYCKMNNFSLLEDCFCCEYARNIKGSNKDRCKYCPILWGSENSTDRFYCESKNKDDNNGLWWTAQIESFKSDYKKAAEIARQIANLPEKI